MRYLFSLSKILLFIVIGITLPFFVFAASSDLEVSGWIPYWESTDGPRNARSNIDALTEINPFAFSVRPDGSLHDLANLKKSSWKRLFEKARDEDVRILPTVMWSNGMQIQTVLSSPMLRKNHIEAIVDMVKKGKYDGVDIDYEGKNADTKVYYSLFIKELKQALGSKMLSCTTEARTPPDSLYIKIPTTFQYANDYAVLAQYCDTVKIMAYDQQRADIKLNASKIGSPYFPVADVDWVRKVIALTVQTIPREKIMLGFPTYGREVQVTVTPNWFKEYKNLHSVNPNDAMKTAKKFKEKPSQNKAGEISFSYTPKDQPKIPSSIKAPGGTPSGEITAARALAYANQTGKAVTFNYVSWSNADAIEQKIELAKQFGLRGVSMFKIDGGEDEDIWDLF